MTAVMHILFWVIIGSAVIWAGCHLYARAERLEERQARHVIREAERVAREAAEGRMPDVHDPDGERWPR
jgi:hypothetical protein